MRTSPPGFFARFGHQLDRLIARVIKPPSVPETEPDNYWVPPTKGRTLADNFPEIILRTPEGDFPAYFIQRHFPVATHNPVNITSDEDYMKAVTEAHHRSSGTYSNPPDFDIDYEALHEALKKDTDKE